MSIDHEECPACGATPANRQHFVDKLPADERDQVSVDLHDCPHCYAKKCCMCDMGDDVSCLSCEGSDE